MAPGQVRDAWLIDRRSSAEAPQPLLRAALKNCEAGRAKVPTVMGHAGADMLNVRDILVAQPHRVWFASRTLLRAPMLRSCGQRRARERETEKRTPVTSKFNAARIPTMALRWWGRAVVVRTHDRTHAFRPFVGWGKDHVFGRKLILESCRRSSDVNFHLWLLAASSTNVRCRAFRAARTISVSSKSLILRRIGTWKLMGARSI
jgi:hypothetical protein